MDIVASVLCIFGGFAFVYVVANLMLPDNAPLQGVYAVPGGRWYTLKWLLIYCTLKIRVSPKRNGGSHVTRRQINEKNTSDVSGKGYGIATHGHDEDMERVTGLNTDSHAEDTAPKGANNSVYIFGINPDDGSWVCVRIAKRQNGVREVWFFLRLPGIGDVVLPQHPRTIVHNVRSDGFEGAGLKVELEEPLKLWRVTYEGECRIGFREKWAEDDERTSVNVSCCLRWTACTPHVNFDTDLNPRLMAENIAKEKWNRTLFDNMKSLHQTHYEQFGIVSGVVNVTGHPEMTLFTRGVRDRSFGPRNWADFYAYCLLFAIFEDGTSMHVGSFCIPKICSHLNTGFSFDESGNKIDVVSSSLSLPRLMPKKIPPVEFSFDVKMEDGMKRTISVHTVSTVNLFTTNDSNIVIQEGHATFTMNGVSGHGVSEWLISRHKNDCLQAIGED